MPDGAISPGQGFFGGLATGIFDAMNERRLQAREREAQERRQSLSFLTSLMDQVEPESRPLLIKQIGEVMGLKGKQRSFWDRLTGGGLDSGREAIQERTQGVLESLVGPPQAAAQRGQAAFEAATSGEAVIPQTFAQYAGLDDRLVMRDPRQEALAELKTRYGMQARAGFEKLEEQQRLMSERQTRLQEDRQRHEMEVLEYKSYLQAKADITKRAHQIASSEGRVRVMPGDEQKAALQLISEQGLTESLQKALLELREAQEKRAEAEVEALRPDPLTGEVPGKPMTPAQKQTADSLQQQRAQATFNDYTKSRAQVAALNQQIQSEETLTSRAAAGLRMKYNPSSGEITMEDGSPAGAAGSYLLTPRLKIINDLKAQRTRADIEAGGHRSNLLKNFKDHYRVNPSTGEIEPVTEFGGVSPAGAPRTPGVGQTYDATTSPSGERREGKVSARLKVGDTDEYISTISRAVGDIISVGRLQYRVLQILPSSEEGKFVYKVKRIR